LLLSGSDYNRHMFGFFKKHPQRIYLDYASATPVCEDAARASARAAAIFANPGSIHADGIAARDALAEARAVIARELAVKSRELVFTSGGTEGNNLAILGFARKRLLADGTLEGTHWLVSSIEHPSVLECFGEVERLGGAVEFIDPQQDGRITPESVALKLRTETVFVSIGWANSEIGTVQSLADISCVIRDFEKNNITSRKVDTSFPSFSTLHNIIFHTDMGQAPVYKYPHVHTLGVDIATLDSGKLYGPRGIGAVYLNNRVELAPVLLGGGQERGLRAGTENVALAAGFAAAMQWAAARRESETKRLEPLREELWRIVREKYPGVVRNGSAAHVLPHILNVSLPDVDTEYLTLRLDAKGIAVSTKSACREKGDKRSHVVEALCGEADAWRAGCTLRFSLGAHTDASALTRIKDVIWIQWDLLTPGRYADAPLSQHSFLPSSCDHPVGNSRGGIKDRVI